MPYQIEDLKSAWGSKFIQKLITLEPNGGRDYHVALVNSTGIGFYEASPLNGMKQRDGRILERNGNR